VLRVGPVRVDARVKTLEQLPQSSVQLPLRKPPQVRIRIFECTRNRAVEHFVELEVCFLDTELALLQREQLLQLQGLQMVHERHEMGALGQGTVGLRVLLDDVER